MSDKGKHAICGEKYIMAPNGDQIMVDIWSQKR